MTANHRRKKERSKNRMKRRVNLYTRVGAACLILLTVVLGGMKVFHIGPLGNGYMEIYELHKEAKDTMNDKYDEKKFIETLLKSGNAPFSVIQENVEDYIKSP